MRCGRRRSLILVLRGCYSWDQNASFELLYLNKRSKTSTVEIITNSERGNETALPRRISFPDSQ